MTSNVINIPVFVLHYYFINNEKIQILVNIISPRKMYNRGIEKNIYNLEIWASDLLVLITEEESLFLAYF